MTLCPVFDVLYSLLVLLPFEVPFILKGEYPLSPLSRESAVTAGPVQSGDDCWRVSLMTCAGLCCRILDDWI